MMSSLSPTHGLWSPSLSPVIVDCGSLPDPEGGMVVLSETTFGSSGNYSCDLDRLLTGDSVRSCQANGTWSGAEPICGMDMY